MYYPYLRGRQFELIALRELAKEGALNGVVLPIIEPVKDSFNSFDLAFAEFSLIRQPAYVIVNSQVGHAINESDHHNIASYIKAKNEECSIYRPAFHYDDSQNVGSTILQYIQEFDLSNCLLICKSEIDYEAAAFRELANHPRVEVVSIHDPGRSRGFVRALKKTGKPVIRFDDLFQSQKRNSDFLPIHENRFSEEHLYFSDEGFSGFSDYTALPSAFSEGGSTPYAVVIHLTYLHENGEIWIRHFTSTTNDSGSNVQGKFAEAAQKAVIYCDERNLHNSALDELRDFYHNQHYPGLGVVKKLSIKNHILVVAGYLNDISGS